MYVCMSMVSEMITVSPVPVKYSTLEPCFIVGYIDEKPFNVYTCLHQKGYGLR